MGDAAVGASADQMGDEAVERATGRRRDDWFERLDAVGAEEWKHAEIARHLAEELGVHAWWAQSITVAYEQARGIRRPGQRADGTFEVAATRTLPGSTGEAPDAVLARLVDAVRDRLGEEPASVSSGVKYPTARWRLETGSLLASASPTASGKVSIGLTRRGLPSDEGIEQTRSELAAWLAAVA